MKTKNYHSVEEMVKDTTQDEEFVDCFSKLIKNTKIIKFLKISRSQQNLSVEELAKRMKCSTKKVTKIEEGLDKDLSFKYLKKYIKALMG